MPRFYFDTGGGGAVPVTDAIGLEFVSLDDARAHAVTLLPLMSGELPLRPGEFRTWTSSVRDEDGAAVARYILAIINDSMGLDSEKILRPMA